MFFTCSWHLEWWYSVTALGFWNLKIVESMRQSREVCGFFYFRLFTVGLTSSNCTYIPHEVCMFGVANTRR
jgi:hypothetical protein